MGISNSRRKALLALGLTVLTGWALFLALRAPTGVRPSGDGASTRARSGSRDTVSALRGSYQPPVVERTALEFAEAYLAYQVGELDRPGRRALAQLSTRHFGAQLLRAPPRPTTTGVPNREWASRVDSVHVGVFEGGPALFVGVIAVGLDGAHVVVLTLKRRDGRWAVAGIGA